MANTSSSNNSHSPALSLLALLVACGPMACAMLRSSPPIEIPPVVVPPTTGPVKALPPTIVSASGGGASLVGGFAAGTQEVFLFRLDGPLFARFAATDDQDACLASVLLALNRIDAEGASTPVAQSGADASCARIEQQLAAGNYEVRSRGVGGGAVPAYHLDATFYRLIDGAYTAWAPGEPASAEPGQSRCATLRADNFNWQADECSLPRWYACVRRDDPGTWKVTDAQGPWWGGPDACAQEFGDSFVFGVPGDAKANTAAVFASDGVYVWMGGSSALAPGHWAAVPPSSLETPVTPRSACGGEGQEPCEEGVPWHCRYIPALFDPFLSGCRSEFRTRCDAGLKRVWVEVEHRLSQPRCAVPELALTGTLYWDPAKSMPIDSAKVTLNAWVADRLTAIATGTTDALGGFSFKYKTTQALSNLSVYVTLEGDLLRIKTRCDNTGITSGSSVTARRPDTEGLKDWKLGNLSMPMFDDGGASAEQRFRIPWNVLLAAGRFEQAQGAPGTPLRVDMCIDAALGGRNYYHLGEHQIHVGTSGYTGPGGQEILLHEYGHKVMRDWMGETAMRQVIVSASSSTQAFQCDKAHSPSIVTNANCALLEGWAHFFALSAVASNNFGNDHVSATLLGTDFEQFRFDGFSGDLGPSAEGWVTAALWDLADGPNDGNRGDPALGRSGFRDANAGFQVGLPDFRVVMTDARDQGRKIESAKQLYRLLRARMTEGAKPSNDNTVRYDYLFPETGSITDLDTSVLNRVE